MKVGINGFGRIGHYKFKISKTENRVLIMIFYKNDFGINSNSIKLFFTFTKKKEQVAIRKVLKIWYSFSIFERIMIVLSSLTVIIGTFNTLLI